MNGPNVLMARCSSHRTHVTEDTTEKMSDLHRTLSEGLYVDATGNDRKTFMLSHRSNKRSFQVRKEPIEHTIPSRRPQKGLVWPVGSVTPRHAGAAMMASWQALLLPGWSDRP